MRRLGNQRGQTSAEWLGLVVVVAAIVVAIGGSDIGGTIACNLKGKIAEIGGAAAESCDNGGATAEEPGEPTGPFPPSVPSVEPESPDEDGEDAEEPEEENWCGSGSADVPEGAGKFVFSDACKSHDECYGDQRGRRLCDDKFLADMLALCAQQSDNPIDFRVCSELAALYYAGVRAGGGYPYWNSGGRGWPPPYLDDLPTPPLPSLPGLPDLPGLPGLPELPGVPGLPGLPGLPNPGLPNLPDLPNPGLPDLPDIPRPDIPGI